ncbi:MAG: branched-chain amino acid ABC transporter ATP-binding protein, partial [Deltaproteobacteria bacterium]|nr:branched-chain amino acid ABC transporter ATP-binding protein [Deltaproteobacteria bacterium]
RRINQQGVTVLLVEQNLRYALENSTRGYVLETGKVTLAGSSAELLENPHVKKAYLGI